MTLPTLILSSIIVFVAFLVRGLAGFGGGLIMVPLFLLYLDITLVVPASVFLNLLASILVLSTFQTLKFVRKDLLPLMIAGAIIGVVGGTWVLSSIGGEVLGKLAGLLIAGYAVRMLHKNGKESAKPPRFVGLIAGFFGGFLNGMFGTGGPPIVMYLNRCARDKQAFRATATFYFLSVGIWQLMTSAFAGVADWEAIRFALYMLPAFAVGSVAGSFLHTRVAQKPFERIVALLLLSMGILLVVR